MVKSPTTKEEATWSTWHSIYGDPDAWERCPSEQRTRRWRPTWRARARTRAGRRDALVGAAELAPDSAATSVRVRDGEALVTDGPYAEVKESLGGYYLFACDVARRGPRVGRAIPAAWHGGASRSVPSTSTRRPDA